MINLFWSGLLAVFLLSGCGWSGTPTRENDFTPLTSITISADSPSIAAGTSTRLTVTGNYSGLFTRNITDQVVWSSESPAVADFITAVPHRVKGLSAGPVTLTATLGTVSGTYALTVNSETVTALTITPAAPSIAKGRNKNFSATATLSNATTQDLTFDAAWHSGDSVVATVNDVASDATDGKGFAQGLAVGTSTITATFPVNGVTATTLLTVTAPVLQSILVTPSSQSVLSLSKVSFAAIGTYSDGSTPDITSLAAWSSSASGVATITTGGVVTTLAPGTASVTATLDGINGTTSLKVTGGNLTGITLSTANITLVKDTVTRIAATGTFNNGGAAVTRDITGTVTWAVADTAKAAVTTPGGNLAWLSAVAVTPVLTPTTVTATFGTLTGTTSLAVTAPALQSVTIAPTALGFSVGVSNRLALTALFADGTTQNVTTNTEWTSNIPGTASVGNIGLDKGSVTGVTAGSASISAAYGALPPLTATVTVTARTLAGLTITGSTVVTSGNQVKFTATANYLDGTSQDVTEDTIWTIDKTNVAILADSVNQPGQVVGVDSGSATLTGSFGGKSQTVTIAVP